MVIAHPTQTGHDASNRLFTGRKRRVSLSLLSNTQRNRRCAFLLSFGLLTLSLAVFGWGLQYKLSLYQGKGAVAHLTPEAKLLSQKERPLVAQALSTRTIEFPPFLIFPALLLVASAAVLRPAAARYARTGSVEKSRAPMPPCLQALFLRPPPALT